MEKVRKVKLGEIGKKSVHFGNKHILYSECSRKYTHLPIPFCILIFNINMWVFLGILIILYHFYLLVGCFYVFMIIFMTIFCKYIIGVFIICFFLSFSGLIFFVFCC